MARNKRAVFLTYLLANLVMAQITDNELQRIKLIRNDVLEAVSILGELEYQKIIIELDREELKTKIKNIKIKEKEVFDEIKEKYGEVSLNIETGEIN
jgi:hypothetical protein